MTSCAFIAAMLCTQISAPAAVPSSGAIAWRATPDEALAESRKTGKAVAIYFYADWCRFSQKLNSEVLSRPEIVRLFERFIPCKVDCDTQRPLMRRFRDVGFPVVLFFDADGKRLDELDGVSDPAEYASKLQDCIDTIYERKSWEHRAAATPPDAEALARLALLSAHRADFAAAADRVDRAIKADPADKLGLCLKVYLLLGDHARDNRDPIALSWYQKAVNIARDPAGKALALLGLAEQHYGAHEWDKSIAEFEQVSKMSDAPPASTQRASDLITRIRQKQEKIRQKSVGPVAPASAPTN